MFFFYLKTVTTEKGAARNLVEVSSERKGSIGLFQDCNYVYKYNTIKFSKLITKFYSAMIEYLVKTIQLMN